MMLGEALRDLAGLSDEDVARAFGGNSAMLERVSAAAAARQQSLSTYVYKAACLFLERASETDWSTALARMQSDGAPGDRLVELAVERQLDRDGR